jgi:hypothetical protein
LISSNYDSGSPFDLTTNKYKALKRLNDTDPALVPVPNDLNGEYLLLQRYVLVLLYIITNVDLIEDGVPTCDWSGVSCTIDTIKDLLCTYSIVQMEPDVCSMKSALTADFFFFIKCLIRNFQEAFLHNLDF